MALLGKHLPTGTLYCRTIHPSSMSQDDQVFIELLLLNVDESDGSLRIFDGLDNVRVDVVAAGCLLRLLQLKEFAKMFSRTILQSQLTVRLCSLVVHAWHDASSCFMRTLPSQK